VRFVSPNPKNRKPSSLSLVLDNSEHCLPPLLIVSASDEFAGITSKESTFTTKDFRIEAAQVKAQEFLKQNNKWNSAQFMQFIDSHVTSPSNYKLEPKNLHHLYLKDMTNDYPNINQSFRDQIKRKTKTHSKLGPVFLGGDRNQSFCLPQLKTERHQQLRKEFQSSFENPSQERLTNATSLNLNQDSEGDMSRAFKNSITLGAVNFTTASGVVDTITTLEQNERIPTIVMSQEF
jgi:hypothetical protein